MIGGAIVATGLLAYLLWPRSAPESGVLLVPADQRQAAPAAAAPIQPTAPAVQPAAPVAAAPPQVIPEGLKLTGVTATGAIFSFSDGSQRLVRRGRPIAPGLTLQAVRLRDVIVTVGTVNYRLGFGGAAVPIQAQPSPALAPPGAPAPPLTVAVPAPPSPQAPAQATPQAPLDRNMFR